MRLTGKTSFLLLVLGLIGGFAAMVGQAGAQQPEKRIALVVGNSAYAKSPLATAANDAGLIAQTLQAAGFDVVGARDLDGDTLRKSLREFIQKAQASGPGTVAMVYLAGYGVQLAGENYFVPVDSAINQDTDVPTEALRVSDYMRQLAALPSKANIVVLDAARQQPFIESGPPIASGLALVEPEPNMLVAFNAAPGTVAPSEQGPYGIYAQSVAEMIRTGGLVLPEVFNRVRLRVNDASKGAQVPWNAEKIEAQFTFFERAPDAPPVQGTPDQVAAIAAIQNKPLSDLGAQEAYTAALERDTLPAYEEFLAAYPNDPLASRVRAIVAARREAITWRRTYRADTPEAYWSYLRRYPRGPHAADARRRLAILTAPPEPPPSFAMIDYDIPPPPPDEIVYVDRPVLYLGDPDFGFMPPPPPPVYYLPPPPPEFVVLPPPIAPVGLFILPQPIFVPIPVFVRPPVYVAPPPNNIIYTNIHNRTVINNVINQPPPAIAGPGSPAVAAGSRLTPAAPAVPPAVAQRATLIQQGKLPVPPSASINPISRAGTPAPAPANVAPNVTTPPGQQRLPAANTLPVPGARGAPPSPPGAGPASLGVPITRPPPSAAAPAVTTPPPAGAGPAPPGAANMPSARTPPAPATTTAPAGTSPKPPGAQTVTTPGAVGPTGRPGASPPPPLSPPGKPAVTSTRPSGPPSPPPQAGRPRPPVVTPPPPSVAARPVTPPPRVSAPPSPPPRISAPPSPPRVAAPSPPPPRMAAPPPRVAAPPPPPPRMAAPPPRVAAPPPPPPRMAAPPPSPPRMAAPPSAAPRPAAPAARNCPPDVPRC